MKRINIIGLALWLAVVPYTTLAGDAPVLSLNGNGILAWTNSFTNALFTVQWASSLQASPTNTSWIDDWTPLKHFSTPTGFASVAVPMLYRVRCQPATIRLGEAFFDDSSDLFRTNSYWPLPPGGVSVYDGFGAYAGYSQTYQYSTGELFAEVRAVKMDVRQDRPGSWTNTVYWAAYDILGNLRILKAVRDGTTLGEASATNTPMIARPACLFPGTSWSFSGAWYTVVDTNATYQGYTNLLKIQWVSGFDVDQEYYQYGVGRLFDYWHESPTPSGWRLRMQ